MSTSWFVIATYIELGEKEKAENLIDKMYEYALEKDDKMMIATSDGLKADLFRAEKKWEESFQLFEKSFQEFEAVDARHARTTLRGKVWVLRRVLRCTFPQNNAESNITYLARAMDWQTLKST